MRLIVLEGKSNKGKTTTIGLLYNLLLINGGISNKKTPIPNHPGDFEDIVIGYKNFKIAVFSMGDNSTAISQAIDKYQKLGCELFICSLSTNKPQKRANNKIKSFSNVTKIAKTISNKVSNHKSDNNKDASNMFNII